MPYVLDLPRALKAEGLDVEVVPGWQTRGNASFNPGGAVAHWTAGPKTGDRPSLKVCIDGRPGLEGPLCNTFLPRGLTASTRKVIVVAAGRANHAGKGGWKGLVGNSSVFGTEAENSGSGEWTDFQRWAYPRINAAYARLGGFGPEMVCGHNEWAPTRKIDIRDWPMPAMRVSVKALLAGKAVTTKGDWFDMATRDELRAVLKEELKGVLAEISYTPDRAAAAVLQKKYNERIDSDGDGKLKSRYFWDFVVEDHQFGIWNYRNIVWLKGQMVALQAAVAALAASKGGNADQVSKIVSDAVNEALADIEITLRATDKNGA